jgi:hypothetical protein
MDNGRKPPGKRGILKAGLAAGTTGPGQIPPPGSITG